MLKLMTERNGAKLELGVKEMMTRHLMLEAMQEVRSRNGLDTRQALKLLKSGSCWCGTDIDIVESKPPYWSREPSLHLLSRLRGS